MNATKISSHVALAIGVIASALAPAQAPGSGQALTPFSAGKAGAQPPGWSVVSFGNNKPATQYRLVDEGGKTVLQAHAESATGGLTHPTSFDVRSTPILEWRWKISNVVEGADNRSGDKEDAAARVVLGFDGDKSKLGFRDRTASAMAKSASGRDLPYAQLAYIWSTSAPVGTVITHPHTQRLRMIVVASGAANAGKWMTLSRNVVEDFKRAYGEEPGALTEVGVLTDSDNTGAKVDAWYGDIRFVGRGKSTAAAAATPKKQASS